MRPFLRTLSLKNLLTAIAFSGMAVVGASSTSFAEVSYDQNLRGPESRARLADEQARHKWVRLTHFRSDGVTISGATGQGVRTVISSDPSFTAWSKATGLNLESFTYLQLREVDVSQVNTIVGYNAREGLFQVNIPFAAGLRYTTSNILRQGTLFVGGHVVVTVGPSGPVYVKILSYNDSQEAEAFSRQFTSLLNDFDGKFAAAVVAPVLKAQLADSAILKDWLDTSGATNQINVQRASLNLR